MTYVYHLKMELLKDSIKRFHDFQLAYNSNNFLSQVILKIQYDTG